MIYINKRNKKFISHKKVALFGRKGGVTVFDRNIELKYWQALKWKVFLMTKTTKIMRVRFGVTFRLSVDKDINGLIHVKMDVNFSVGLN